MHTGYAWLQSQFTHGDLTACQPRQEQDTRLQTVMQSAADTGASTCRCCMFKAARSVLSFTVLCGMLHQVCAVSKRIQALQVFCEIVQLVEHNTAVGIMYGKDLNS